MNEQERNQLQAWIDEVRRVDREWAAALARAEEAEAKLAGSEERAQILFEAKNIWADRARAAEAKLVKRRKRAKKEKAK